MVEVLRLSVAQAEQTFQRQRDRVPGLDRNGRRPSGRSAPPRRARELRGLVAGTAHRGARLSLRALHYLYYLVVARKHGVHVFELSQELPQLLRPGGAFEGRRVVYARARGVGAVPGMPGGPRGAQRASGLKAEHQRPAAPFLGVVRPNGVPRWCCCRTRAAGRRSGSARSRSLREKHPIRNGARRVAIEATTRVSMAGAPVFGVYQKRILGPIMKSRVCLSCGGLASRGGVFAGSLQQDMEGRPDHFLGTDGSQILCQPLVARVHEAEDTLDDEEGMLDLGAHAGLDFVLRPLGLIDGVLVPVTTVREVFGLGRMLSDDLGLSLIGRVPPTGGSPPHARGRGGTPNRAHSPGWRPRRG